MSLRKKAFHFLLLILMMTPLGCSKPQSISNVARILYDRYHERLLNVRFNNDHQLLVIFKMNPLQTPPDSVQRFAFHLAKMAYTDFSDTSKIDSVIIRFQSTGAPTIINEKTAKDISFLKKRLE